MNATQLLHNLGQRVKHYVAHGAELIGMETVGASTLQAAMQKTFGFEPDGVV